jgi:quinolinate synthase
VLRIQRPLPAEYTRASSEELADRVARARAALGSSLVILGHHYQRDEVMRFADRRGDSLALSRFAASTDASYVVFCGVHFMAEAADILTSEDQAVILPDLNAGCSMADMADEDSVASCWDQLGQVVDTSDIIPVTYMNSSAALKAFVGRQGGSVCTSSNAAAIMAWALERAGKVLFFPDQHLGRNTANLLKVERKRVIVWDPSLPLGGNDEAAVKESQVVLWKGHCSIHQRFRPEQILEFRLRHPEAKVIVHPECSEDVVALADEVGSTDQIIKYVQAAPAGSVIGVGTEIHLVARLAKENPDKQISSLDPLVCPCSTMNRITLRHLAWVLEALCKGTVVNRITVDGSTKEWALVALHRMLSLSDPGRAQD